MSLSQIELASPELIDALARLLEASKGTHAHPAVSRFVKEMCEPVKQKPGP